MGSFSHSFSQSWCNWQPQWLILYIPWLRNAASINVFLRPLHNLMKCVGECTFKSVAVNLFKLSFPGVQCGAQFLFSNNLLLFRSVCPCFCPHSLFLSLSAQGGSGNGGVPCLFDPVVTYLWFATPLVEQQPMCIEWPVSILYNVVSQPDFVTTFDTFALWQYCTLGAMWKF